jgi:hypothetical protein
MAASACKKSESLEASGKGSGLLPVNNFLRNLGIENSGVPGGLGIN